MGYRRCLQAITGSIAAWGAYFADRAGQRDAALEQLANDLYRAFDVGCNFQTDPGGQPPYPSNPWRRYHWDYRPSGSFSWIMNGLGGGATPVVSLTSPANGAVFVAPANIGLAATASVAGASITKVEFFSGTTKIGDDTSAPYSFTWSAVPAGRYTLAAKATASNGTSSTSAPVSVSVSGAGCGISTPGSIYNKTFPAQSGTFTVVVNATPRAVGGALEDTGIGVNTDPPAGESNSFHTAATVRFNTANGRIEARSGSSYPVTAIPWTAGQTYRIRLVLNVPAHTYAAYVTPPGGAEQVIGTNLTFRSNYATAASLNNLRGAVDGGSIEVCPVSLP